MSAVVAVTCLLIAVAALGIVLRFQNEAGRFRRDLKDEEEKRKKALESQRSAHHELLDELGEVRAEVAVLRESQKSFASVVYRLMAEQGFRDTLAAGATEEGATVAVEVRGLDHARKPTVVQYVEQFLNALSPERIVPRAARANSWRVGYLIEFGAGQTFDSIRQRLSEALPAPGGEDDGTAASIALRQLLVEIRATTVTMYVGPLAAVAESGRLIVALLDREELRSFVAEDTIGDEVRMSAYLERLAPGRTSDLSGWAASRDPASRGRRPYRTDPGDRTSRSDRSQPSDLPAPEDRPGRVDPPGRGDRPGRGGRPGPHEPPGWRDDFGPDGR
ncbi:hypothetical protein [Nonomuraea cavernae]|uniref:hypothetical protein n=1 Tax=Nonomuraea cavernae TaxID=2045107 RepID=UPI0033ECE8A6